MTQTLSEWIRRPQWSLRTALLFMLVVAVICSLAATYMRALQATQIEWTPYSLKTIARCQEAGTPVIVLYHNFWATSAREELWAAAPFHDPETVRVLNQMKFVMMDPGRDYLNMTDADFRSMREAIDKLGAELPVIAIYDARRGDVVIRPKKDEGYDEGYNERRDRVGKLIREYAIQGNRPGGPG
ncbi:MAG: hypothetical protein ACLP9L_38175 [Thermoguttaceae bacterium]